MTRILCLTIYAAFSFLLFNQSAYAGAWTQKQNSAYVAAAITSYSSDAFLDLQGNKKPQPTFQKYEINLYGEYGYSDELTVGANLFLQHLTQDNASGSGDVSNIGIGDSEIFARYLLWQGSSSVLSVQPLIKLPSYYKEDHLPQGGSNTFDTEISVLYGHNFSLFNRNNYLDTRIGYRHRTDDILNDQIKADIKIGFNILRDWQVIPAISYTKSTSLPSSAIFTQSGQNDYDLLKLEGTLLYRWRKNINLFASAFAHVDGKNTGQGTGITVGTGLQF